MQFMPNDDPVAGPLPGVGVMATFLAEDWVAEGADLQQLIVEAEELLNAVDLAISGSDFAGDKSGEQMQRCWAFIGPGLHTDLQSAKDPATCKRSAYSKLAVITMALTARRQTLELNGIEVLRKV